MKLSCLLSPWIQVNLPDIDISSIEIDSRKIKPGALFLACKGATSDGRQYIQQAIAKGAAAVIYEQENALEMKHAPVICIPLAQLNAKIAKIASIFYNNPSKKMRMTGITGTNGKTTIAWQLAQAHHLLSQKAAYIGTLGEGLPSQVNALDNTTPDGLCLQKLFSNYQQAGIQQVCMEVSSHALSQSRVDCIDFNQAIFTNLTLDHLDYHKTMADYAASKALLFAMKSLKYAILNADDSYSKFFQQKIPGGCQLVTYGIEQGNVRAIDWQVSLSGTEVRVQSPWGEVLLKSQCLGYFNIYNLLALFTSLMFSGYKLEDVSGILPLLKPAPGRMEIVAAKPWVLIDYAHTPDALDNVLTTLTAIKQGRILVIFGCGGDRDKSKRAIMGEIASKKADIAIITSDNPRTEDPEQILKEIESGVLNTSNCIKIANREEAIARALALSQSNDLIVIAGKGHETYQQIGTTKYPFSDKEVVNRIILASC